MNNQRRTLLTHLAKDIRALIEKIDAIEDTSPDNPISPSYDAEVDELVDDVNKLRQSLEKLL